MKLTVRLMALALGLLWPVTTIAQPTPAERLADALQTTPDDSLAVTQHTLELEGQEPIHYYATTGYKQLRSDSGEEKAKIFFMAYTRSDQGSESDRPITFTFNGGPGSSSVWLHLGALGPRRVAMGDDGEQPGPPYRVTDNIGTWLGFTDLVFLDPVSTGYSRATKAEEAGEYHGLEGDIQSVGEFIRLYLTQHQRWASPKFLCGESYGTTRAAGLSGYLQQNGIALNGIVLVSAILEFQTARFDRGNDLPYALFLPTYTATAWYHERLPEDLQGDLRATLDEVEAFAEGEYVSALMKGAKLSGEQRRYIAEKLSRYTGLDVDYLEQTNLRIDIQRFCKELMRDGARTVGRLDSRYVGTDYDSAGETPSYDPSMSAIRGPYTGAFNAYVREELGYKNDLPYEILTGRVHPWTYGSESDQGYIEVASRLRSAISQNPGLKVLVAAGYYDLATPYFAAEYTMNHLGLDPSLQGNIRFTYFESGHMMYVRKPDLLKLQQDAHEFYRSTLESL
ncbi:MAG: peptidase S10 [Planctomycetota bacterium]